MELNPPIAQKGGQSKKKFKKESHEGFNSFGIDYTSAKKLVCKTQTCDFFLPCYEVHIKAC